MLVIKQRGRVIGVSYGLHAAILFDTAIKAAL
jgi:hypothetical protein